MKNPPKLLKLLLFVFVLSTSNKALACENSLSSNNVNLFINLNSSYSDWKNIKEVSCKLGMAFITLPSESNEIFEIYEQYNLAEAMLKKWDCERNWHYRCDKLQNSKNINLAKFNSKLSKTQKVDVKLVYNILKELSANYKNIKIFLNGKSDSGYFSGLLGSIYREDLKKLLNKDNQIINSINSLYLLGKYSAVVYEVENWIKIFPNLKLVAGYGKEVPEGYRITGQKLISSLLQNENDLSKMKSEDYLKRKILRDIDYSQQIDFSLYVKTNNNYQFYYNYGSQLDEEIRQFKHSRECELKMDKISDFLQKYDDLYFGKKKMIDEPSQSYMSKIYDFAMEQRHCSEYLKMTTGRTMPSPNQVFKLLYFKNIKSNFTRYYKEEIELFLQDLSIITQNEELNRLKKDLNRFMAFKLSRLDNLSREMVLSISIELESLLRFNDYKYREWVKTFISQLVELDCVPNSWYLKQNLVEAPHCNENY